MSQIPEILVILERIRDLLTVQSIDAQPKSMEARRRITFFVNSLYMDLPKSPRVSFLLFIWGEGVAVLRVNFF